MHKRVTRNIAFLALGDVVAKLLAFLSVVILARRLTEVGFGKLAFAQTVAAYLVLVVNGGVPPLGTREIAKAPGQAKAIFLRLSSIRMVLALVGVGVFVAVLYLLPITPERRGLLLAFSVWMLPLALNPEFVFQGLERMTWVAVGRVLSQLAYLGGILVFIHAPGDVVAAPFSRVGAEIIAAAVLILVLVRAFPGVMFAWESLKGWRMQLRESLTMAASFFLIRVYYSFDTLALAYFKGDAEVGWYNAAFKLILVFQGFATLMQSAFAPTFSRWRTERGEFTSALTAFALLLSVGAVLFPGILILLGREGVLLVFGERYLASGAVAQVLAGALAFIFLDTIFLAPLLFGGFQRLYLYAVGSGAVLNIVLNLLMVPRWGGMGAAVATSVSNGVVFGAGLWFFIRRIGVEREALRVVGFQMALGCGLLLLALFLGGFGLPSAVAFSLAYCGVTAFYHRRRLAPLVSMLRV